MRVRKLDPDRAVGRGPDGRVQVGGRHDDDIPIGRDQLNGYAGSLTVSAPSLSKSGRKASSMTASSSVRAASTLLSRLPGCGPCTKPGGCKLIDPTDGGADVVANVAYDPKSSDYRADVAKVAGKGADAIVVIGFNDDGGKVLKEMI